VVGDETTSQYNDLVSVVAAVGQRYLPRGWGDLGRQVAIWVGFLLAYQVARGMADLSPRKAIENGMWVVEMEQRLSSQLYELALQQYVMQRDWLDTLATWTYWNSQFTVLSVTLLWVYTRRHEAFYRFRNALLLANVLALVGYVLMPTAPPRLLGLGFIDTHKDGLVQLAANPYAAMPSIHAADALIVGIVLATVARRWWAKLLWAIWPAWVFFAVMATGNHFWLDCLAGWAVAVAAMAIVYRRELRGFLEARQT
jgi:membrane-associated phospholipid phosphatase